MNRAIPPSVFQIASLFFILLFVGCKSFPKGYRLLLEGETAKAKTIFEKKEKHRVYGPGATYYKEIINLALANNMAEWGRIHNVFCILEDTIPKLSARKIHKLAKYQVRPVRIRESMEKLEGRILEYLCIYGTIPDLDTLYENIPCWLTEKARDSIRIHIVNKTIDPNQPVFENKCQDWVGRPDALAQLTMEQLLTAKGRSCAFLYLRDKWQISYNDASSIIARYEDDVLEANYPAFWDIQEHIWDIFTLHHSYCEMPRFKAEHPDDRYALDCWFDNAHDTLCLSSLQPLLTFHRNNPHTILDIDICQQILCLSRSSSAMFGLNAEERTQVEDVRLMSDLQQQFLCRELKYSPPELISKMEYLAQKYPQHRLMYDLVREMSNYFFTTGQISTAQKANETLVPLFPDKEVCPTNFDFQTAKQNWFANYSALLQRASDSMELAKPMRAWNTAGNNEYALVSWGTSDEVYFVQRNRINGQAQVMSSFLEDTTWSKPRVVPELSVANDIVPLSITADGRLMLLRSGGRLLQSYRHETRRPWSKPDPLPMNFSFGGKAMLSPDGYLLLLEDYSARKSVFSRPRKDIFVSKLGPDGRYGRPIPVGDKINLPKSDEGNPLLAVGGRMLIYTSDQDESLGYSDLYSVILRKPGDWSTAGEPMNMGLQLNTVFQENGLSYLSEYTGMAYFDRYDNCTGDVDIWRLALLPPEVFPPNAMRLAGMVLDENWRPITGGFMEFTTDYNLRAQSQLISQKGSYSYTTPDSSEVIRLFPEIPGYYSERDTTHFLAQKPKGRIVRDTFILTSFEHIRQHFQLRHSTFINGIATFDNPLQAYPELTRLAKIATRMGAELELTGHTDSTGAEGANEKLALDRAQSVKDFLVEKCGFQSEKIKVFGFGPTRPICSNATEEGRRCNRRVEVVFRMPVLPSLKGGAEMLMSGDKL